MGLYAWKDTFDPLFEKHKELDDLEFEQFIKDLKEHLHFCKIGLDSGSEEAKQVYEITRMMLDDLQTEFIKRFLKQMKTRTKTEAEVRSFFVGFKKWMIRNINNPEIKAIKIRDLFYKLSREGYPTFYIEKLLKYNEGYKQDLERYEQLENEKI